MNPATVSEVLGQLPAGAVLPTLNRREASDAAARSSSSKVWSPQQVAIFDWYRDGDGNLVARARAGTGKTTTIIAAIGYAPEKVKLLAAFNKSIADELGLRLQAAGAAGAEAKTLHSVGNACVGRYWPRLPIDKRNARAWDLASRVCGGRAPDDIVKLVAKLHTKGREIQPHAARLGDLTNLAVTFECEPDDEWAKEGYDLAYVEMRALEAMTLAAAEKPIKTGIDFADMVYLPIRNRWLRPMYDLVTIDEAQDMSNAQLELARGVCGGRICVVGDDRQAIYGFRGADSGSIDRLKAELKAKELGLTVTYRCGRAIVDVAKVLVPDFEAGPNNPAGEILTMAESQMVAAAQAGDFILSRKNAPLAAVAMALVRAQKRVRISGRDIGAGLLALVKKLADVKYGQPPISIADLLERIVAWEQREVERAIKADRAERVDAIRDQGETLRVLCEGVAGIGELQSRIDDLFTDRPGVGAITCSSVHKAKGLEADRVFMLTWTFYPPLPKGVTPQPGRAIEEQNIEYVAITRAKRTLVKVFEGSADVVSMAHQMGALPGVPPKEVAQASRCGFSEVVHGVTPNDDAWRRCTKAIGHADEHVFGGWSTGEQQKGTD